MGILIGHLLSGLIGVIIGVLFEEPLNQLKKHAIRSWRHLVNRPKHSKAPEAFSFGHLVTSWVILDGDGELEYTPETIECHFASHEVELPPDLLEIKEQIQQREDEKRQKGLPFLWNGKRYSLDRFVISRTALEENLYLQLWFRPSDYFTFLATNMSLDMEVLEAGNTISLRDKYLQAADWSEPGKFFSNSFGVNLAVITADGYLLLTQRSETVGSRPGEFNISVNEGLSRLLDRSDQSDVPDVYRCAIRGAAEELGIGLKRSDILFLSFGVDTQYSQWALLGMVKTDQRAEEILQWRATGVKDRWENAKLHAVPFDLDSLVCFVLSNGPWHSGALACIYHTLVHEFKRSNVEAAIGKYSR